MLETKIFSTQNHTPVHGQGNLQVPYLTLASLAVQDTLKGLPRKSADKVRRQKQGNLNRYEDNNVLINALRDSSQSRIESCLLSLGRSNIESLCRYAELIENFGVGNCMEHAIVALSYLHRRQVRGVELVALESPGDHVFLVLGSSRPYGTYSQAEIYSSQNVVICDPWAKIACLGCHYLTQWTLRMHQWQNKGKEILLDDRGTLGSPNNFSINYRHQVWFSLS